MPPLSLDSDMSSFTVGDWQVDPPANAILRNGQTIRLEPKQMSVLVILAARAGVVVSQDVLLSQVWSGTSVTEKVVARAISELRKALGDDPKQAAYIETIPKSGYRLTATVSFPSDHQNRTKIKPNPRELGRGFWRWCLAILLLLCLWFLAKGISLPFAELDQDTTTSWVLTPMSIPLEAAGDAVLSPDGAMIAYAKATAHGSAIMVRNLDRDNPLELTSGNDSDVLPAWSRDGRELIFTRFDSSRDGRTLCAVSVIGGEAQALLQLNGNLRTRADWAQGRIAISDNGPDENRQSVFIFEPMQGRLVPRDKPDSRCEVGDIEPAFNPAGDRLAFLRVFREGSAHLMLALGLKDKPHRIAETIPAITGFCWQGDQTLLITGGTSPWSGLWQLSLDQPSRPRLLIARDGLAQPSAAVDGSLVTVAVQKVAARLNVLDLSSGEVTELGLESSLIGSPAWQPGNNALLFTLSGEGYRSIRRHDLDQKSSKDFYSEQGFQVFDIYPSPTQDTYLFNRSRNNRFQAVLQTSDGELRDLCPQGENCIARGWSADGEAVYLFMSSESGWRMRRMKIDGEQSIDAFELPEDVISVKESPDGRWLYGSLGGQGGLIRMLLFNGPVERLDVSLANYDWGAWVVDDKGLYFVDRQKTLLRLMFQPHEGGSRQLVHTFAAPLPVNQPVFALDVNRGRIAFPEIEYFTNSYYRVINLNNTGGTLP